MTKAKDLFLTAAIVYLQWTLHKIFPRQPILHIRDGIKITAQTTIWRGHKTKLKWTDKHFFFLIHTSLDFVKDKYPKGPLGFITKILLMIEQLWKPGHSEKRMHLQLAHMREDQGHGPREASPVPFLGGITTPIPQGLYKHFSHSIPNKHTTQRPLPLF